MNSQSSVINYPQCVVQFCSSSQNESGKVAVQGDSFAMRQLRQEVHNYTATFSSIIYGVLHVELKPWGSNSVVAYSGQSRTQAHTNTQRKTYIYYIDIMYNDGTKLFCVSANDHGPFGIDSKSAAFFQTPAKHLGGQNSFFEVNSWIPDRPDIRVPHFRPVS